jgi:hypothetical protein
MLRRRDREADPGAANMDRSISTLGFLDLVGGFMLLLPWLGVVALGWDQGRGK